MQIMKIKLKEISNIRLGYSFRSKFHRENKGNVKVIQMKDLTEDLRISKDSLDRTQLNDFKEHHKVRKNDLIFKARGNDITACLLDFEINNVILAAPLLRIRIEAKNILHEYVFWYINQRSAQAYFASRTKGTTQKMINKQSIEELEIKIPSLEQQHKIVKIAQLAEKEQKLLENLRIKKSEFISAILLNNVKENNYGNKSSNR